MPRQKHRFSFGDLELLILRVASIIFLILMIVEIFIKKIMSLWS